MSPVIRPDAEPPVRASVADEMEAIFGAAAGRPLPAHKPVAESPLPPAPVVRRRRIGAPLLAGMVVLAGAAGVIGVSEWRPRAQSAPQSIALEAPRAAPSTLAPAQSAAAPVASSPIVSPSGAPPAVTMASAPSTPVTGAPIPAAPLRSHRLAATPARYAGASPDMDDAPEDVRDRPPPGLRDGPCAGLGARRRYACTLDALSAADGRLRRAYDSAVVTGVPRRDLLAMRERWGSLRRAAARRPLWVVAQYEDLADEMEAASSRAQ